jgi:formylmethanofuran dehydrogenase subunit C
VLALIVTMYLLKKYVLSGLGGFLKKVTDEYLRLNNDRIVLETKIDHKLGALTEFLEKFIVHQTEMEKRGSERIAQMQEGIQSIQNSLQEHFEDFSDMTGNHQACRHKLAMMKTDEFRVKREEARQELIK